LPSSYRVLSSGTPPCQCVKRPYKVKNVARTRKRGKMGKRVCSGKGNNPGEEKREKKGKEGESSQKHEKGSGASKGVRDKRKL